jgi:hypothetical protein
MLPTLFMLRFFAWIEPFCHHILSKRHELREMRRRHYKTETPRRTSLFRTATGGVVSSVLAHQLAAFALARPWLSKLGAFLAPWLKWFDPAWAEVIA